MALTSTQERPGEDHRDQSLRRLCRANLVADGRRLGNNDIIALVRCAFWVVAPCLAPGTVRICGLRDRAVLDFEDKPMNDLELRSKTEPARAVVLDDVLRTPQPPEPPRARRRVLPLLLTALAAVVASGVGWAAWDAYMGAPWTRDGTVRAYVVTMAPQVAGQIVALPVADNRLVRKGDLLMTIDPTNYKIAVSLAEAALRQAQENARNAEQEAKRRLALTTLSTTIEEKQTFETRALTAQATVQQTTANLDQARVNLERTQIRSPVNGFVTNLLTRLGDYATVGVNVISLVDADSYWVDGYFEETSLEPIQVGDPAAIKLMGYSQLLAGHVDSVARAITVANARPGGEGLASVNPIFTWVRLAQRIPVRIHIDRVPEGVRLVAGMTATVEIHPRPRSLAKSANYGQPFSGLPATRDELLTPSYRLPGD
jgi:RND family efflux transporter MFP subunit